MDDVATGFNEFLMVLTQTDFFTGILPFTLSWIVFYFATENVPNLGDNNSARTLVALIFAFFVAAFLANNPVYTSLYTNFFTAISLTITGIIGFLLALSYLEIDIGEVGGGDTSSMLVKLVIGVVAAAIALSVVDAFAISPAFNISAPIGLVSEILFEQGGIYLLIVGGIALVLLLSDTDADGEDGEDD